MKLSRKQLSLLSTLMAMSIVVLLLYSIQLGEKTVEDEDYVVELLVSEELVEELEEQEEQEVEKFPEQSSEKTHMAFNETAKPSYGTPEPLKTLAEILQEKEATEQGDETNDTSEDSEYTAKVKELAKKRQEAKALLGEKEAKKQEFTNYLAEKRTTISYSLVDRNSYTLPPPIYTCIEGGKVVINIIVTSSGYVTDASFNEKSSSTSNGCLVENAITYALKARFNSATNTTQKGTITYLFQSK